MDIVKKLTLDVARDGVQANVLLVQGEAGSRALAISLRNGGAPISFDEGVFAAFRAKRPDGGEIFNSCIVYTENGAYPNTIYYNVTQQNVAVAGTFNARIEVANAQGEVLWSPEFSVTVKENRSVYSDVGQQSEYSALIDAVARAETSDENAEKKLEEMGKVLAAYTDSLPGQVSEAMKPHTDSKDNPHSVTAEQVGLGNVDNTADTDKPVSSAQKAAIDECVKRKKTAQISVYTTDTEQSSQGQTVPIDESVSSGSIPKRGAGGCLKVGDPMNNQDAVNIKALQAILEAFVKKNAEQQTQQIDGRLFIVGDVGVDGAINAHDIYANRVIVEDEMVIAHNETMNVKDAYVVTNSEYSDLPTLSGYLINTPTLKTYGIVYDRVNDCVKIGIGSRNGTVFTFDEGEAQALATRGVIEGGHLPIWDSEKSSFVDSEVSVDDIATKKEIGLIDEALDAILEIQAELIGGETA